MCRPPMFIVLEDASPKQSVLTIQDSKIGVSYDIVVTDRRLGEVQEETCLLILGVI